MNHEQHTELLPLGDPTSQFAIVLRGFDRGQVHEHVDRLEADLRIALHDRDIAAARSADLAAQLAAAHGELEALRTKMQRLELPTPENIGERVRHMLALAEEEANDVRGRAHEEAAALHARSERVSAELDAKRSEAEEYVSGVISEAEQRATTLITDAEQKSQQTLAEVIAEHERLETEAAAKRQQADEDFEIALRSRRTEQAKIDAEKRAALTAENDERRRAARAEAEQLVTTAQHRVDQLRSQRRQILEHLAQVRQVLDKLPTADELEAAEQLEDKADGEVADTPIPASPRR